MKIEWRDTAEGYRPFVGDKAILWAPQEGSQVAFMNCPIQEILFEGTRGPGKTDALLMKFYKEVGQGWGLEWRGVIFRRTYPELQDIIEKSLKWFTQLCPGAKYNRSEHTWTFPDGEKLSFRHFEKAADYWRYHGHAYTFIGWEELCTWPADDCFKSMFSTLRSTAPGIPLQVCATANPYGVGHNWVKARYRLPVINPKNGNRVGRVIRDEDGERVAIHGDLRENLVLLKADPNYIRNLKIAARNEAELRAWLYGDWNIVAGGMFDDIWTPSTHVIPSIPWELIPRTWRIDRSYDHGQSKPFSVGWWAESNGEIFNHEGRPYGHIRGDLIRMREWYGCTGKPNEGLRMLSQDIARGIMEREVRWGINGRVRIGPADSSIFDPYEADKSVAGEMRQQGVLWDYADKRPGSRKQGWDQLRKLLRNALPVEGGREEPGLLVTDRCQDFIRTVPILPRSAKDLDDIDSEAEDHIGDEVRYRVRRRVREVSTGSYR